MIREPSLIQNKSFEIIQSKLVKNNFKFDEKVLPIVTRVIHTTADFDYAKNLVVSNDAVNAAFLAFRSGCDIITDTTMAMSGVNKNLLERAGVHVHCFIADKDVAKEAKERGVTRAYVSMEKSAALGKRCIYAVGNAPTALVALRELIGSGKIDPALIIAVPVGFVNVVESKEDILDINVPHIVSRGQKGGSNVAAAICNALLTEYLEEEKYQLDEKSEKALAADKAASISQAVKMIKPASESAKLQTAEHLNKIAKPLGSLGMMEDILVRLGGVRALKKRYNPCVVVMCADNGVVAEGVSQTGSDVTAKVAANMTRNMSSVCLMALSQNIPVFPYDIGMISDVEGVTSIKTMYGTNDFYIEPAMSGEAAQNAVLSGINVAVEMYNRGFDMIATGEMGIGNTTTSSAVAAVLADADVESVTGRGAGLSDDALLKKIEVIKSGIKKHNPDKSDVLDVLAKVGGLDIAGMAGVFIGGASLGIPVIIDGFISEVAALSAAQISPASRDYMIPSHMSKEPGAEKVFEKLGLKPLMSMGMALGEGTGAVSVIPLINMAASVYFGMPTFDELDMEAYKDYEKKQ